MCNEAFPLLDLPLWSIPNTTENMPKRKSKKGACSSNTQTAKGNCLEHNRRNEEYEKVPSYVNKELTENNRTVFEDAMIKDRKSIVPLIRQAEKLYTEKTGQKCQKSFAPFREACLHLKEGITDTQLMDFKGKVEELTGWKVVGIWLHEDEGHARSKYIEGDTKFEINHHAHVLFSCQDINTGKAIRNDRRKLSKMQDVLAECVGMERGYKASETGIRHRDTMQQRIAAQEEKIEKLEEQLKSMNVAKARKEAAIEIAKNAPKTVQEGIKSIFGMSTKDKKIEALETALNAQERKVFDLRSERIGLLSEAAKKAEKAFEEKEMDYQRRVNNAEYAKEELKEYAKKATKEAEDMKKFGVFFERLFIELWKEAEEAVQAIVDFANDNFRRSFTQTEMVAIDNALGDRPKAERRILGVKLIAMAKKRLTPLVQQRLDIIRQDIDAIAKKEIQSLGRSESRGLRM